MEEGDGLPTTICYDCRRLLDVSYSFKQQVEQSDAKFRKLLMLKETSDEENEKILSLSHSVDAAIAEAIADEIAQERGVESATGCTALVGTLEEAASCHGMVHDLEEHHYVTHDEPIIFRIEPPPDHECVLAESLTDMRNAVCEGIVEKNMELTDCGGENRSVDVLIEKYDQLVDSSLNGEAYKSESMLMSESSSEDECNLQEAECLGESNSKTVNSEELCTERLKSDDEEKPLSSRTQRFKCPNCIKTFATKSSLDRHSEIHKKQSNARYACTICDKQFDKVGKLKNHLVTDHESVDGDEKIRQLNEENGRTDKQSSRSEGKKNVKFGCNICGKQFTYQKSFLTHAKTHPGYEPETIFENNETNASEESNERGHESEDDDLPLEGLQCTQCGKLFATKRNLKRHISTHSGLKFHCSACSKEFSRIDKLKEHEQSKHKEEFFASSGSDSEDDTDNENKHDDDNEARKKVHNSTSS